jgi:hypothetical protein
LKAPKKPRFSWWPLGHRLEQWRTAPG